MKSLRHELQWRYPMIRENAQSKKKVPLYIATRLYNLSLNTLYGMGITKRWTGLENRMENGTENGLV